jgi:lipoyl(octanoyl) transferase
MNRFFTLRPGRIPYRSGLVLQTRLLERRLQEKADILVLLEHTPVVTVGRGVKSFQPLVPLDFFARNGIDIARTGRGGDVTFHGPGQVVGYPIVSMEAVGRDLHLYLRMLENVLLDSVEYFAVTAERIEGRTGIWVEGKKIASIGVGVRRWVSWHGFALNVGKDLSGFDTIVPCGLEGVEMTSLEKTTGRKIARAEVEEQIVRSFGRVFHAEYLGEYEFH